MDNVFGSYLRKLRLKKKVTLRQLAEHLGCSEPYLSDVEYGRRRPLTDQRIYQAASFLRVPLHELRLKAAMTRGDFKLPAKVSPKHDQLALHLSMAWESLSTADLDAIDRILAKSPTGVDPNKQYG